MVAVITCFVLLQHRASWVIYKEETFIWLMSLSSGCPRGPLSHCSASSEGLLLPRPIVEGEGAPELVGVKGASSPQFILFNIYLFIFVYFLRQSSYRPG